MSDPKDPTLELGQSRPTKNDHHSHNGRHRKSAGPEASGMQANPDKQANQYQKK